MKWLMERLLRLRIVSKEAENVTFFNPWKSSVASLARTISKSFKLGGSATIYLFIYSLYTGYTTKEIVDCRLSQLH